MNKLTKAMTVTACAVAGYAYMAKRACKNKVDSPDYLLILGCRVRGEEAEDMLLMRITDAALFLKKNPHTIAIACGGIVHADQQVSEAEVIKRGLVAYGIAEERIIPEDKSQTTVQNFVNAKKILHDMGADSATVAFITSDFHVLRASAICKKAGVNAKGIPASSPKKDYPKALLREMLVYLVSLCSGR